MLFCNFHVATSRKEKVKKPTQSLYFFSSGRFIYLYLHICIDYVIARNTCFLGILSDQSHST